MTGNLWYAAAALIVIFVLTPVRAAIPNDIVTASVECTEHGFKPAFDFNYQQGKTLEWSIYIGDYNKDLPFENPCRYQEAEHTAESDTTKTVDVADLNEGNVIPYEGDSGIACNGAFENSEDKNTIDYKADVNIVVTETLRGSIQRQKRFPFKLECSLTRDQNKLRSSASWTIKSALTPTDTVGDATDTFELAIDFDFYTDNSRTTPHTKTFSVTMVSKVSHSFYQMQFVRIKFRTLFHFSTKKLLYKIVNHQGETKYFVA